MYIGEQRLGSVLNFDLMLTFINMFIIVS